MKKRTLAILLCLALLLPGCTPTPPAAEPTPTPVVTPTPDPTPDPTPTPVPTPTDVEAFPIPEMESTPWQTLTTDKETFGLTGPEGYEYLHEHVHELPLDQLVIYSMYGDGYHTEVTFDELRTRFLQAPHKVLSYLVLLEDQTIQRRPDSEPKEIAKEICRQIASADACWYEGSEEFAQTMAACREDYPSGPVAALLDILEAEHAASMARNHPELVSPSPSP